MYIMSLIAKLSILNVLNAFARLFLGLSEVNMYAKSGFDNKVYGTD